MHGARFATQPNCALVLDLIGQSDWLGMSEDVKGDAYEGLLEKNAQDTKSGAGQAFTLRPLIDAIVGCIQPTPGQVSVTPRAGPVDSCSFARLYPQAVPEPRARRATPLKVRCHPRSRTRPRGCPPRDDEPLASWRGGTPRGDAELPISCEDSLVTLPIRQVDVVLTNPPFGVKGSFVAMATTYNSGERELVRKDFWVRTANKQLNFLQHVYSMLKPGGRAAVVVPDNVLFRRRSGRRDSPPSPGQVRCPHTASSSYRYFLCPRRESKCPFLRPLEGT